MIMAARTISPFRSQRKPILSHSDDTNGHGIGNDNGNKNGNENGNKNGNDDGNEKLIPTSSPAPGGSYSSSASSKDMSRPSLPPLQQKVLFCASPNSSLGSSSSPTITEQSQMKNTPITKENVTVTVRFRPLSSREVQKGDEVAWYADGDMTVRSEYNAATAYGFDKVFGPATTTRHVYDVAAQHIVNRAMEGVNGTVFAYGVTSSGKTHTMHGDQKSPGIIPLAVKDVFSIIQETPEREFLLRVSYLEIYNEVINDLLDPAGQNLRIREDVQGTYVEGIKEDVVLSPAHCLSLIATGEEHRHVGSNNFNLLSSRSHTIFTLTIESSPRGDNYNDEEVSLSHLNLIDLAGSESSKTETTGLRRKEGSYINKSLLTLGTVISKLTDGKAAHIPYRDSKLTRLLQSSLSGHGHISLICTVTPASTSNEETHNTLKFAHRTKHVETHASQNKIMDEKSLIKKYQKEILSLKLELEQVKQGMANNALLPGNQEDIMSLKQQLEAGQVKLQSRLEEEEQAKAALLGRIQRLTKLILVSTKNTVPQSLTERVGNRRRHSFGEDELAYLPDKKRDGMYKGVNLRDLEQSLHGKSINIISDDILKGEKKTKKRSMLAWFNMKKNEHGTSTIGLLELDNSSNVSPATGGSCVVHLDPASNFKGRKNSVSWRVDQIGPIDPFSEATQAGELFSVAGRGRKPPPTGTTMADQIELLREQVKMLAGEVALLTSSLRRLSEQATTNPDDYQLQFQIKKLKDEIQEKESLMSVLERQIVGNAETACNSNAASFELSQTISKLSNQLNENLFELEIKAADNRILQDQLNAKAKENTELRSLVASLREQLTAVEISPQHSNVDSNSVSTSKPIPPHEVNKDIDGWLNTASKDFIKVTGMENEVHDRISQGVLKTTEETSSMQGQIIQQAIDIEQLRQENHHLHEEKNALHIEISQLAEESSYAKELASAAGVELKNLSEEITKLSYQNTKLAVELTNAKESAYARPMSKCVGRQRVNGGITRKFEGALVEELRRELLASKEKEVSLEGRLAQRESSNAEMKKKLEEMKRREADLENDLANAWFLLAKLKNGKNKDGMICLDFQKLLELSEQRETMEDDNDMDFAALKGALENERSHTTELKMLISRLKSEDLNGLNLAALEDLSALHIEALTRLCHAKKAMMQGKIKEERGIVPVTNAEDTRENRSNVCKMCYSAAPDAIVLPCRHFSLCKSCAEACTICPLCKAKVKWTRSEHHKS